MNRQRIVHSLVAVAAIAFLSGCGEEAPLQKNTDILIERTTYGVPHITAANYHDLAKGIAYAHAEDNVCLLAEHLVSARGERSKYFGTEGENAENIAKDFFARYYYDGQVLEKEYAKLSPVSRDLVEGYVSGYNAYLKGTAEADLPKGCRGAAWVGPMAVTDMFRIMEELSVWGSGQAFYKGIVGASPQKTETSLLLTPEIAGYADASTQLGSNAWAFGSDVTATGSGLLVGNPHFPWQGDNRFYQLHLNIPGEYDVMGATIAPLPVVAIGFNKDIAWSHTVSTGRRFTIFELSLDPENPENYMYDGESLPLKQVPVTIEIKKPNGNIVEKQHVFYESRFGPLMIFPQAGLKWTAEKAYALADVNRFNLDTLETWLKIGKSSSVAEIDKVTGDSMALPWINILAADRTGNVLYADHSRVPNVSAEMLNQCLPSKTAQGLAQMERIFVMDGSSAECDWTTTKNVPGGRYLAEENAPEVQRTDYVANSNDSYWLVNGDYRFDPVNPLIGFGPIQQNLRTRAGIQYISEQLAFGTENIAEKMSLKIAHKLQFAGRNFAAELILDDLLSVCDRDADLEQACAILRDWDKRETVNSKGAVLFREFWLRVYEREDLFAVAFDSENPVETPNSLDISNDEMIQALFSALKDSMKVIRQNEIDPAAPLGEVQFFQHNGKRIAVPGGRHEAGVLNMMHTTPLSPEGYFPLHGSSYIQMVTFNEEGPVANGILTYSQSVNPASKHYSDQTERYSSEKLYRLPFSREQIKQDPEYSIKRISGE